MFVVVLFILLAILILNFNLSTQEVHTDEDWLPLTDWDQGLEEQRLLQWEEYKKEDELNAAWAAWERGESKNCVQYPDNRTVYLDNSFEQWFTKESNGWRFGKVLICPREGYLIVEGCLHTSPDLKELENCTGNGWEKCFENQKSLDVWNEPIPF